MTLGRILRWVGAILACLISGILASWLVFQFADYLVPSPGDTDDYEAYYWHRDFLFVGSFAAGVGLSLVVAIWTARYKRMDFN